MKYATFIEYGNRDAIEGKRPRHREYLSKLQNEGKLSAAGAFEDDSGALIIYETETQEQAEELFENDPFRKAGVFKQYTMKPWRQIF